MIADKLEKLGEYARELDKEKPGELVENYMKQIESELRRLPKEQLILGNKFGNDITRTINNYIKKGTLNSVISYHLLNVLVSYVKLSLIENKANLFGIDRKLYKQEMNFLFKGK
jgi:hypothetical protein